MYIYKETAKVHEIVVTGGFKFTPFSIHSLTVALCNAQGVGNKDDVVRALWWPEKYMEEEVLDWEKPGTKEVLKRNEMRGIKEKVLCSLDQQGQGGDIELEYIIFSPGKKFYSEWGYREAQQLPASRGYECSSLAWFLSFMVAMPEELQHLPIACPLKDEGVKQGLYPYFTPSRGGELWFDYSSGDSWCDDEITFLNRSLMFGVRPKVESKPNT